MCEGIKGKEKYFYVATVVFLLGVLFLTRLWKLDVLPLGIHIDEAGMAYDAWCLSNWGVDRYFKSWPVYLTNFSTGQSSLYAFICAILFSIFGESVLVMRLPAVIFSFVAFIFGMKIARKIYNKSIFPALFVGGLVVICPYFIMNSRIGLDCNLMLGTSTLFLYFFHTAMETNSTWRYIVAGLAGGLVLYSYVLSYIVLPLFLFCSLIYVCWVRKFHFHKWFIMAVPMAIMAFPLILVQIVNYFGLEEMRLGIFTITKLNGYRIGEISSFNWDNFLKGISYVFIGDGILFDSIPGIWNLYQITCLLFIVGLISSMWKVIKNGISHEYNGLFYFIVWFALILVLAGCMNSNTYRMNGIFFAVVFLAVEGLCQILKWFKKIAPVLLGVVCVVYVVCFMRFSHFYYGEGYTANTYMKIDNFGLPIQEGISFIEGDALLCQKITYVWERSIYYAVSKWLPPQEFDVIGDSYGVWNQYWFGSLGEITPDYNYMVPHGIFEDYCRQLREAGFEEKRFEHYSVFFKR